MLANLAAALVLGIAAPGVSQDQAEKAILHSPETLKADFNKAKGVPRVVIILSPS